MIRCANINDLETIVLFNDNLAKETESLTLNLDRLTKGVQEVLNNPSRGQYYVYEKDGAIIGQLLITYEWSDWRNANFWWIQSVYVHKDYRNQGIFKALFNYVKSLAMEQRDVCGLRLYVERENRVAKKTYQSLGMEPSIYDLYFWEK